MLAHHFLVYILQVQKKHIYNGQTLVLFLTLQSDGATRFVQGTSEMMRITSAGNVGIGTTNPGSKLEVKTSGTNTTVELDNSDTDYTVIQYNAQGATKGFSGFNAGFMLFGGEAGVTTRLQAGGSYAATILTNGNFGIGTTSPSALFSVANTTVINGNGTAGWGSSANYGFLTWDGGTVNAAIVKGQNGKNLHLGAHNRNDDLVITIAGNVGIGTTGPNQGGAASASTVVSTKASASGGVAITELIGLGNNDNDKVGIISFMSQNATAALADIRGLRHTSDTTGKLVFFTSASEKMRIDSAGNVGIGTTNIGTESNLYLGANNSSEGGQITLQKATSGTLAAHIDAHTTSGNDYMRILSGGDTSTSAAPFVFDLTNVRVGIGTTLPGAKLDVAGIIFAGDGNKATPGYSFASDPDTGMFRDSANVLVLGVNADTRLRMSNTDVLTYKPLGVNTTSITSGVTLEVAGNTLLKNSNGVGDLYLGNYATANHFRFHTNNANTYFDMNCGDIYWRQGSSTRYQFFASTANMTIQGTLTQNSDARTKENVVEISDCISKVKAMRGVYYNRTDFNTDVTKVGVIAQEVEAVLPELVLESPETGLKSVAYSELTSVLINAIKEQQEIIEDLKTRITKLEN